MPKVKKYNAEDCFNLWVAMGDDRSIKGLSDVTGKSEGTLNNYSSKFKWRERLAELKEEDKSLVAAFVRDNSAATALLESEVYRGVSEKLLEIISESITLIEPTSNPRELKTMVDTYRLINGQPTDITKQEVSSINPETLSDADLDAASAHAYAKLFGRTEDKVEA